MLLAAGLARAELVYQEGFSDGTPDLTWISTWGSEANQIEVDWMTGNPSGDGFVGKLGNDLSGGGVGTLIVDAPELVDYTVSAQVHLVPGTTHFRGIVGRAHEIVGEEGSAWEFYAFVADLSVDTGMGDQRFMLRRWQPGASMQTIKIWTMAELGALYPAEAGWHELAMTFEGDQITCTIDGQSLPDGTQQDATIATGGFGVYYFDFMDLAGHLVFDDVLVEAETSVAPAPLVPAGLALGAPWPNPFNPAVQVELSLAAPARVSARIHDLRGRLVRTLAAGSLPAGHHRLTWDGRGDDGLPAASGVYLLSAEDGTRHHSVRLSLLR
jgi:hypothetical protein